VYYYHPDHLGTGSLVTNSSAAEVNSFISYPFGGTRVESGSKPSPFKFTDQEKDSSELYYFGARYLDVNNFMRFFSPDPVTSYRGPQGLNRYAYVLNNPIRLVDPTGGSAGLPWELDPSPTGFWNLPQETYQDIYGAFSYRYQAGYASYLSPYQQWNRDHQWIGELAKAIGGVMVGFGSGGLLGDAIGNAVGGVKTAQFFKEYGRPVGVATYEVASGDFSLVASGFTSWGSVNQDGKVTFDSKITAGSGYSVASGVTLAEWGGEKQDGPNARAYFDLSLKDYPNMFLSYTYYSSLPGGPPWSYNNVSLMNKVQIGSISGVPRIGVCLRRICGDVGASWGLIFDGMDTFNSWLSTYNPFENIDSGAGGGNRVNKNCPGAPCSSQ